MIWPYLLSVECPAPPQTCEFERPSDIVVHKSSDIGHGVALTHDERPRPVGRMAGWLGVHTYDPQSAEHEWRESPKTIAALRRDGDCRESHARELFEHLHFIGVRIQVALVGNEERGQPNPERIERVLGRASTAWL